jgi:hypothetical protein
MSELLQRGTTLFLLDSPALCQVHTRYSVCVVVYEKYVCVGGCEHLYIKLKMSLGIQI